MPNINRIFNGRIDYDTHPYRVAPDDYLDALNITRDSQGEGNDEVVTNIIGNKQIAYILPDGVNKVIGNYPDKVRNRVYYFVWNNQGFNSILAYDRTNELILKIIISKTDSDDIDILNFNPSYRINHVDIIYRNEGDLIYWTDGLNRPSKINEKTAIDGGYGVFVRSYLDAAKEPPSIPPAVTYEHDLSISVNNLRKKLFKFKYRFIYDDFEKSTWSSHSELPLPIGSNDLDQPVWNNSKIALVLQTGASNVKKIEIAACQSLGNIYSDFFLVKVIDKEEESIADNDITDYRFFNNQAYIYVPINESILGFDFIPQKAYTQALPNGNVICYSALTEGYDYLPISATGSVTEIEQQTTQKPIIYIASQSGDSGFGVGDIHIKVIGIVFVTSVFNIYTTNETITYTAILFDTTAQVIDGLSAAAILLGFTVSFSDSENLIISKDGEVLQRIYLDSPKEIVTNSFAFDYNSRYNIAIEYYDEKGVTNSAITNNSLSLQVLEYSETLGIQNIPKLLLFILGRPPIWATSYQILFSKNLSKSKILYWVSDRTLKDNEFAYISIENLNLFIEKNPETPLSYSFSPNDRITFIKNLTDGTNTIYTGKDFEIQDELRNPTINNILYEGKFLKLKLPATSGTFDFGIGFNNYFIELYTPAQSVANGLDVYFEVGERYGIGNAATDQAFHQGMLQNQTADLVTPATFEFTKGDDYYRIRNIGVGADYLYDIPPAQTDMSLATFTLGCGFVSATYNDSNLLTGTSPMLNLGGFNIATDNSRWLVKAVAKNYSLKIKGVIKVDFKDFGEEFSFYVSTNNGYKTNLVPVSAVPNTIKYQSFIKGVNTFSFDVSVQLAAGERLFIFGISKNGLVNNKTFLDTELHIINADNFSVGVIDQNFSDYFASAVNSYGRPWTIDENAKQTFYPTLIRFGGEYQQDTNINQINRFYFDSQDNYDRSNGTIKKMFIEGRRLYIFQEFDIGVVPILTQIVKDTSGNPLEANSDILLNKISYPYNGKFGIGDIPESFAFGKNAIYGCDNNKGVVWRLSQNGITALSVLYKTNSFFIQKLAGFKNKLNIITPETGIPTVYGVFDAYTNKYIICMEAINRPELTQEPSTIAFLEANQQLIGFESRYSLYPENIGCLDNLLISFKDGQVWTHNSDKFCNFFGVQYEAFIKIVLNDNALLKKTFISITETSNEIWECPEIETQTTSYGTTNQESNLIIDDFEKLENVYHAAFLRDSNSIGGVINGDSLKGQYMIIKLQINAAKNFVFLNTATIKYIDSPLNNR